MNHYKEFCMCIFESFTTVKMVIIGRHISEYLILVLSV